MKEKAVGLTDDLMSFTQQNEFDGFKKKNEHASKQTYSPPMSAYCCFHNNKNRLYYLELHVLLFTVNKCY